jgi:hypothetical protein
MNTKDEALQMAIEELMKALKLLQRFEPQIVGGDVTAWTVGLRNQLSDLQHTLYNNGLVEAINACKEALEQPAQEPDGWYMIPREEDTEGYFTVTKPTRQQKISHEPMALYYHPYH